jgi:nucleotide-binding universal stress UspA family protein
MALGGCPVPIIGDRPEINLKAVIYATDFSASSEKAGCCARLLANQLPARLLVAHAFLLSEPAQEVETRDLSVSQQRKDLQQALCGKAHALSKSGVQAEPVLLDGTPADAIPACAEANAPALIVLGTHGAGPIEHGLVGSTAERILRSSRWPCLTVGPRTPTPPGNALPFRRILYATDFTPAAANAAVYALTFAGLTAGTIDTLNVIPPRSGENDPSIAELTARYRSALDKLVPQQSRDFCNPQTYIEVGNAHDRIVEHIQKHAIDLLVLGIRKTSHIGFVMRTSGAFRIIADAPCPVLTITA